MRAMLQPCSAASVRFVVATNITADDINYADMLRLDVARNDRHLGTFLLTVEFFRFAVALRHLPSFIARADDDAYLQPAAILADLNKFSAATQLVYGFFAEWYSWHPRSMQPGCWDSSPLRYIRSRRSARDMTNNSTSESRQTAHTIHHTMRGCLPEYGMVGPFPFAKGPFAAYSAPLAARLVQSPQFSADVRYATKDREGGGIVQPIYRSSPRCR